MRLKQVTRKLSHLFLNNYHLFNFIPLTNRIDNFQALINLAKTSMLTVEMLGMFSVEANEKLRPAGISSCMSHRQYTAIVILVSAGKLTLNRISGATRSGAFGTTSLNNKARDNPMKG
jgi:hypothetical protein